MATSRRARWLVAGVVTMVAATLALAGCGGADFAGPSWGGAEMDDDVAEDAGAPGAPGAPGAAPDEAGRDGDTGGEAGGTLVDPSHIIFTGEIALRVEDVDAAARRVIALADRYGGFVAGDERATRWQETRATIVLRIPSESFTAAVNAASDLGDEEWRHLDTEDVRTEVVDLQTRIATAQASVDRTRDLMERAESISEIVAVEAELTKRETTLASLQARQRELADLTALSTVTVSLFGPDTTPPEPTSTGEPELGFLVGLRAGWSSFVTTMTVLVTVLGVLLPWLVAAGAPTAGLIWWARRRRATRLVQAGSPPGS
jgi:hypothetical protein